MEQRSRGKASWLWLAVLALPLAILLAGMSLVYAQTVTPTGTALATSALGGTASGTAPATSTFGGTPAGAGPTSMFGGTPVGGAGTVMPSGTATVTATGTTTATLRLTLPQRQYLSLDLAQKAANAALIRCTQGGYTVTVTIVDPAGLQKVVLSQDGANPATLSGSYRKAFTAGSLGSPTSALADRVASNPAQAGLARLDDRILLLAGGLPINANNQLVGGIGVSGAPSGLIDEDCARAGIDSLR